LPYQGGDIPVQGCLRCHCFPLCHKTKISKVSPELGVTGGRVRRHSFGNSYSGSHDGRSWERMKEKKPLIRNSTAEFLIFTAQAGEKSIEARFEDDTIWLSQKLMATLFDVGVNTINYHLKEIYESGEIDPQATIRKFRIVQQEGIFRQGAEQAALCYSWPYCRRADHAACGQFETQHGVDHLGKGPGWQNPENGCGDC